MYDRVWTPSKREALLADEDHRFVSQLEKMLARRGFVVRCIENRSSRLLEALAYNPPNRCVVFDPGMGGITWYELLRRASNLVVPDSLVVVTAYGSNAMLKVARHLGIRRVFNKPIHPESVAKAIAEGEIAEPQPIRTGTSLAAVEWEHINDVIALAKGNISAAARLLGMRRATLYRKLQKHPAVVTAQPSVTRFDEVEAEKP